METTTGIVAKVDNSGKRIRFVIIDTMPAEHSAGI